MTDTGDAAGWEEALSAFWAGQVEELRVSLPRHRVVMTVGITGRADQPRKEVDAGVRSWYELTFEGVTRFLFNDPLIGPWWQIELTEIDKRSAEGGKTEYLFDMTSVSDALRIVCDDVRVILIDRDEDE